MERDKEEGKRDDTRGEDRPKEEEESSEERKRVKIKEGSTQNVIRCSGVYFFYDTSKLLTHFHIIAGARVGGG